MDLSTLPIEMIASVAKYMTYEDLVRLRNRSALINTAAQRYGIGRRLPVYQCWFCTDEDELTITLILDESIASVWCLWPTDEHALQYGDYKYEYEFTATDWRQLMPLLDKIKVEYFEIELFTSGEETLKAYATYANAFKQCLSIEMRSDATLDCPSDEFINFVNLFPKAVELIARVVVNSEYILNLEFISSRKWERILVWNTNPVVYDKLDDTVLDLVVTNCIALELTGCQSCFSVQGVARALEALTCDGKSIGPSFWGILDVGDMNYDEALVSFMEIPGINLEWNPEKRKVKVKFDRDPTMSVKFILANHAD